MRSHLILFLLISLAAAQDGAALYRSRCAGCHDTGVGRAPGREALKLMSPELVETALTGGMMTIQGIGLSTLEVRAIATFVTGQKFGVEAMPKSAFCAPKQPFDLKGPRWNGWGADLSNQRSQTAADAGLTAAQVPRMKLKWAFGIPGVMRAFGQPSVAGGRLFFGTAARRVYSLDASSGCVHWVFDSVAAVRTAPMLGSIGKRPAVFFGDQYAQAYAVDAQTGDLIWKVHLEEFPLALITGSPVLHDGRLYVPVSSGEEITGGSADYECCKFRGSITALDAATGKTIWKSYTIPQEPKPARKNARGVQLWGPSGAGVWSTPTIDPKHHALYVTTGDSYSDPAARTSDAFVAFDLGTGKILWSRQMTAGDAFNIGCGGRDSTNCPDAKGPDFDFGSSPILVNLPNGKRALIAGQKSGLVHAVDPDQQGEVLWSKRIGKGGSSGGVVWGSAVDKDNVYVALSDVAYKFGAPAEGLSKTIFGAYSAPDPTAGGGLFALRLSTGERTWFTPPPGCGEKKPCSPAQSAAVTLIPGIVFSGSIDGHLRAYAAKDGAIIWDMDTALEYSTVNGVKASGGSLDGPGPVIVGGALYVNSGYGYLGGMPGNVMLAYTVDGK